MKRIMIGIQGVTRWLGGTVGRKAERVYRMRLLVQAAFTLTCVVIGVQFVRFYQAAMASQTPLPVRPPGVEGFLPIGGLMGIVDWIRQGELNRVHPAASILVLIAVATAFLARKSFCSWICPVGFISELLARAGRKLFGRNFRIWTWLDIPLRGLKYLLLAFFVWSILTMHPVALRAFLESPYHRVADIKMGLFFVHLGQTGALVLAFLALASLFVQGAWCRYLCPYGALLGLFSWMSPTRVSRTAPSCVDCGLCDKACMARLPVSQAANVWSVECTGCLDCVAACPVGDALTLKTARRRVSAPVFAVAVVLIFLIGYTGARLSGQWKNDMGDAEYVHRIQSLNQPEYGHPGMSDSADESPAPPGIAPSSH